MNTQHLPPRTRGLIWSMMPLAALLLASTPRAELIYEDSFTDGVIETNNGMGNQIGGGGYFLTEIAEDDGRAEWGPEAGWNWASQAILSLDEWPFPAPTNRYGIEWKIGPMTVTTSGSQSWGDVRLELRLVPAAVTRGSGDSMEFWSSSKGTLGVAATYKEGNDFYANFGWKNDTHPASSGMRTLAGQANHKIDPAQSNVLRIEFDSQNAALYVNGVLSQTLSLSAMELSEEFENGWYLSTWGAVADNARGTVSVDYVRVDQAAVVPPESEPVTILTNGQPQSQTVFAGTIATFRVQTAGTAPVYQWQRNGIDIPGAIYRTYTNTAVAMSDNGSVYRVKVSNVLTPSGIWSDPATLTVLAEDNHKVFLSFSEGAGLTTRNAGNLGGTATFAQANDRPVFSTKTPNGPFAPAGNQSSLDFGVIGEDEGGRALDLAGTVIPSLGSMNGFTACGWLNVAQLQAGWGGNRILFALASPAGPGFDIVQLGDGSLQLGVNGWPDGSPAKSSPMLAEDPELGTANWVFFAVTYDGAQSSGNVNWFFGSADQAAQPDVSNDYDRGPILQSGALTVGNFGEVVSARNETGPAGGSRCFRGLLDELNVFNKVLTLAEIQAVQKAPVSAPVIPPKLNLVLQGNQIELSWETAGNFKLQSRTELSQGSWTDETATPTVQGNKRSARLAVSGSSRFYRLVSQ